MRLAARPCSLLAAAASLAPATALGQSSPVFNLSCVTRDPSGIFIDFQQAIVTMQPAPPSVTSNLVSDPLETQPPWTCESTALLAGPEVTGQATSTDDGVFCAPNGSCFSSSFSSGASLTYEFVVVETAPRMPPPNAGDPIPIQITGAVGTSLVYLFTGEFGGSLSGNVHANLSTTAFDGPNSRICTDSDFFILQGKEESSSIQCNAFTATLDECLPVVVSGSQSCGAGGTIRGTAPFGEVRSVGIGYGGLVDMLFVDVTHGGFADPLIEIDPEAEISPGVRYADFFGVVVSEGVVQPVPEPAAPLLWIAAVVALASRRRGRQPGAPALPESHPPAASWARSVYATR